MEGESFALTGSRVELLFGLSSYMLNDLFVLCLGSSETSSAVVRAVVVGIEGFLILEECMRCCRSYVFAICEGFLAFSTGTVSLVLAMFFGILYIT